MTRVPILAVTVLASMAGAQSRPGDYGAWYLHHYGPARPKDEADRRLLAEGEQVFASVAAVADRRLSRPPRLLAIDKDGIEAQALPDGTIVVNLGLLRLCYGPGPGEPGPGRARLAFVLGHELAHLAHDDSWHAEAFAALRAHPDARLRAQLAAWAEEPPELRRGKELHADEAGFGYMLMAGHDAQAVLGSERDFLREWAALDAASEGPPADPLHPSFAQRSSALRARLVAIAESVPFFRFGVRLVQLGRPDDALALLQRALASFPGREVESNLGLAHYQRAVAALAQCGARGGLRFLLPVALDPETLASRVQLREGGADDCPGLAAARQDLGAARKALESALERDPTYVPARVNLVVVLLQQGDDREAFGRAREPQADEPRDPRLELLSALALSGLGRSVPGDAADGALDRLDALEARCAVAADRCGGQAASLRAAATFGRARIQQERGRGAAAVTAWRRFLELQPGGPWAEEARAGLRQMGERAGVAETAVPAPPGAPPEGRLAPEARARLLAAPARVFPVGPVRGAFRSAPGLEALELRGTIELIEERLDPPLDAAALEREPGPVPAVDVLEGGRVTWIYRDVAYDVEGGRAVRRVLFQPR